MANDGSDLRRDRGADAAPGRRLYVVGTAAGSSIATGAWKRVGVRTAVYCFRILRMICCFPFGTGSLPGRKIFKDWCHAAGTTIEKIATEHKQ